MTRDSSTQWSLQVGPPAGLIEVGSNLDLDRLSTEDKRALVELLERAGVLTGSEVIRS
jgi:hypothetical protein